MTKSSRSRDFRYNGNQVNRLLGYYLKELRGVKVLHQPTNPDALREAVKKNDSDIAAFSYRKVTGKNAHSISIVIAKDKQKPGHVLVIAQNSSGSPLSSEEKTVLEEELVKQGDTFKVHFLDCQVKQQDHKNTIDCCPLTVVNTVDNFATVLECYEKGTSIIDAAKNGYFQQKLSCQGVQDLTGLREEHANILGAGRNEHIRITPGSKGEEQARDAGKIAIKEGRPPVFHTKRKRPLYQEVDFSSFHQVPPAPPRPKDKHGLLNPHNPGDKVALVINTLADKVIIDLLGLEGKPKAKFVPQPSSGKETSMDNAALGDLSPDPHTSHVDKLKHRDKTTPGITVGV